MRVIGHLLAVLSACGTIALAQAPSPVDRAAKVLADARTALGGEQKIAAVKNFTTTGRTRRVQGENLVPIEFEMAVELPDKYMRRDEIPAQESDPTTNGFNGDALVQSPPMTPPEPRPGMPAPPVDQFEAMLKQRVLSTKQDFARLMLGLFATSYSGFPLTFNYIGQAEAPQGKAHVLEATGAGNFVIRFFVHTETHLPVMVSWQPPARSASPRGSGPARPAPGTPAGAPPARSTPPPASSAPQTAPGAPSAPAAPSSAPAASAPAAPSAPPENRLYFADYRDVDGLKLPFRLRRAVGTDTTEETMFDRFRINTKIDPRKFEVRK
jgi:hypothetical protein